MKITIHIDGRQPHIIHTDGEVTIQLDADDVPIVGLAVDDFGRLGVGIWPDGENWQNVPEAVPQWEPADADTYTADTTTIGKYVVTVCLDDEGPLRPAFYWDIFTGCDKVVDGWEGSIPDARREAIRAARALITAGA